MASTAQHIEARSDPDLLARLVATAEQAGIPNASAWTQEHMGALICTPVQDDQTIADVRAYAAAVREQAVAALPPAPGFDPAAVTDVHLRTAVDAFFAPLEQGA